MIGVVAGSRGMVSMAVVVVKMGFSHGDILLAVVVFLLWLCAEAHLGNHGFGDSCRPDEL